MKTTSMNVKISIAAAVLAVGLPWSASAGQIWDWHGRSEKSLVETLGNPASQVTNPDGTRVYTYVHDHEGRNVRVSSKESGTVRVPAQRHVAEFQIGPDGRVTVARFVGDVTCDIKS